MSWFDSLKKRGLVQDCSDEKGLAELPKDSAFYLGYDPTATSLQLGNLVPLMGVIRLAQAGFKPLLLFGGATGAIGDPTGKDEERKLLSREELDKNIENQTKKTSEILKRVGVEATFVNNLDWTQDVTYLEFLRDIGKYFTVNYMIAKDVVKARLEGSGISYTEFSYMLLQAFDFLYLYNNHNCRMQIGGSDQWGNITAGLELIRKKIQGSAEAFSFPLLLNSDGKKFGKTEAGAIWLDENKTSPYQLHQFLLNTQDQDVIKYLRILTFISDEEIFELEELTNKQPEKRTAQKALADSICSLVHGEEATKEANTSAKVLFGAPLTDLTEKQLTDIFSDVPSSELSSNNVKKLSFLELLVESGLSKSKGEAKRLISNGGAYLNNVRVDDLALLMKDTDAVNSNLIVLRTGKKNYHLIKLT